MKTFYVYIRSVALKERKTIITTRRSHRVNAVVLADFYLFSFWRTTGRRQLGNSQEFPVYAAAVDSNRARKKKMIKSKSLFHTAELAIIIFFSATNAQWYVFLKIHSKGFFSKLSTIYSTIFKMYEIKKKVKRNFHRTDSYNNFFGLF